MTRRALGRGLSALIPDKPASPDEELIEIDIDLIKPNRVQPRINFDEKKLEELAQSIRENGIVQPILVRRQEIGFEIVAGERRWRAAQRAGLQRILSIVRNIPDDKLLELALIENIQRQELNPIEEAKAYQSLIAMLNLTQDATAQRVGRDRSHVTNFLRLLRLPEDIQRLVESEELSMGHARALLGLTQLEVQRELALRIVEKGMTVREAERAIRKMIEEGKRAPAAPARPDANYKAAETKLSRRFGTKVRIVPSLSAPGGAIHIEYYGDSDLDRIYRMLYAQDGGGENR